MFRGPDAVRVAACVLLLGGASPALAHSLRFGVLRAVETPEGVEVELRAGGSEGAPPNLAIQADGCRVERRAPVRDDNLIVLRARLRCASRDAAAVRVEGLDEEGVSLAARVERGGADAPFVFLEHDADRLPLRVDSMPSVFPRYLRLGAEHIAEGFDHLVFVLLLALLASHRPRPARALVGAVTGFTVGHSVTLSLSALGAFSLPSAPVEACIALSIVLLSAEILRGGEPSWGARFPAALAAGFGLLHGLGFAGALREVGLPPGETPLALIGFNVGVELGQLAFVLVLALAARVHFRLSGALPEKGLAWLAGGLATVWTALRLAAL
ncbi:MAG: HupE/UreJ family protein [Sandaracinaceae bacterium]